MIPPGAKINHEIFPNQLRPDISTSLSTTYLCQPSTKWQWRVICYYRICKLGLRKRTEYSFLRICLCLAVWLCIKMSCGYMVLMRLLQIGSKDLTVQGALLLQHLLTPLHLLGFTHSLQHLPVLLLLPGCSHILHLHLPVWNRRCF